MDPPRGRRWDVGIGTLSSVPQGLSQHWSTDNSSLWSNYPSCGIEEGEILYCAKVFSFVHGLFLLYYYRLTKLVSLKLNWTNRHNSFLCPSCKIRKQKEWRTEFTFHLYFWNWTTYFVDLMFNNGSSSRRDYIKLRRDRTYIFGSRLRNFH